MFQIDAHLFIDIVETGSIAEAARRQGISPSYASRRISSLEAELNTKLFLRTTRSLEITDAGKIYLEWAHQEVENHRNLVERLGILQETPTGDIRVAADAWLAVTYLPDIIGRFWDEYPHVNVTVITSGAPSQCLGEDCELAICTGPSPPLDLVGYRVYEYRRFLCASRAYIEAFGEPSTPEQLREHRCLLPEKSARWYFRACSGEESSVDLTRWASSNSWLVLRDMAIKGLGVVSMGGSLTMADLDSGRLQRLLPDYEIVDSNGEDYSLWVLRTKTSTARTVGLFARFALKYMKENPIAVSSY